jgi:hypothetical protein
MAKVGSSGWKMYVVVVVVVGDVVALLFRFLVVGVAAAVDFFVDFITLL